MLLGGEPLRLAAMVSVCTHTLRFYLRAPAPPLSHSCRSIPRVAKGVAINEGSVERSTGRRRSDGFPEHHAGLPAAKSRRGRRRAAGETVGRHRAVVFSRRPRGPTMPRQRKRQGDFCFFFLRGKGEKGGEIIVFFHTCGCAFISTKNRAWGANADSLQVDAYTQSLLRGLAPRWSSAFLIVFVALLFVASGYGLRVQNGGE